MAIVDELITLLGFDIKSDAAQKVKKFEQAVASVHKTALVLSASLAAAATAIAYFAEKATSSASELNKYNELTGTSAEEIQKWAYAAEQAGGSAHSVKSDIEGLLEAMNPVMPGEFNQGLFLLGMYGKKYKDTTELMLTLTDKLQGMTPMEQMAWAKKAGISNDTLLLMKKGRSGIQELMKATPFLMSEGQTAAARKFEQQINKVKSSVSALSQLAVTKTLPTITKLVDQFEKWSLKNGDLVSSKLSAFITGVTDGISKFAGWISTLKGNIANAMPFVDRILTALTDPKLIGGGVALGLGAIVAVVAVLAAKWVLIGGAIALAVLALEEFMDKTDKLKDTAANKVLNVMYKYSPKWTHSDVDDKMQSERDKAAQSGSKSNLLQVLESLSGLVSGAASTSGLMNQAQVPATNNNSNSQTNVTVNNEVNVNGSPSPYETGQEVGYRLGAVQWGGLTSPVR